MKIKSKVYMDQSVRNIWCFVHIFVGSLKLASSEVYRSLKLIYQQHTCMCGCCYKWSVVSVAGVLTHSEVLTMHFLS